MSGRAKPVETLSTCLLDLESMYSRNHGISFAARQRWFQQEQLVDARPGESLVVGFLVCGRHLFPVPGAFFYVQVDLWAMVGGLGMELSRA